MYVLVGLALRIMMVYLKNENMKAAQFLQKLVIRGGWGFMKNATRNYLLIKPLPLDLQLVDMCRFAPQNVSVEKAIAQFRWCIETGEKNKDFQVLRTFLGSLLVEQDVRELEVLYETNS